MKKLIHTVIRQNNIVDSWNYTVVLRINGDDLRVDEGDFGFMPAWGNEYYPMLNNSTSKTRVEKAGMPAQAFEPYPISYGM